MKKTTSMIIKSLALSLVMVFSLFLLRAEDGTANNVAKAVQDKTSRTVYRVKIPARAEGTAHLSS